jgi:hypothetical protein
MFSDVWGPAPSSVGKFRYYVSFIDDFSKFTWVYLLKNKYDVFHKFHDFQQLVEHLFDRKILAIQTDWGGGGERIPETYTFLPTCWHLPPCLLSMPHPGFRKQNRSLHTCAHDVQITCTTNNMVNKYNISLNYKLESFTKWPVGPKKDYRAV